MKLLLLKKIGSHPNGWLLRALGWAGFAVVLGPLCLGITNAIEAVIFSFEPIRRRLILAAVQPLAALMWYVPLGVIVVLPVLVPVLLILAMLAPTFPSIDRTWRGILVTVIVLSSVAAGAFASDMPLPWHFNGRERLTASVWVWFTFATGLFAPRLLFRWLRPGSFLSGPERCDES